MNNISKQFQDFILALKGCRLCWRITAAIFMAILFIEATILIFSVDKFKRGLRYEVEREGLIISRIILRDVEFHNHKTSTISLIGLSLRQNTVLSGMIVYDLSGTLISQFGDIPTSLPKVTGDIAKTIYNFDNDQTMEVMWPSHRTRSKFIVLAKIDTMAIAPQVNAYIWRIIALILLISIVVTAVAMLVLERLILRPIRLLRDGLSAIALSPKDPAVSKLSNVGIDEFGEVTRGFDQLTTQLRESFAKIEIQNLELQKSKDEAEQANVSKSKFLASMSHELRTPMNAVLGFAQLLQNDPNNTLSDTQNDQIESILLGGNHLLELINEVLDLARIEANQAPLVLAQVNAIEILTECISMVSPIAEIKEITIDVKNVTKVNSILRTDPLRFKQILINLLSNAVKYNEVGGSITVEVLENSDKFLHISITDTGIGIPQDSFINVFKPFHRAQNNLMNSKEGTGIGLTVTKLLIERMAGHIGFNSLDGIGSTFWIELPLASNPDVFIWTDILRVGVDEIDKDHQILINLTNKIMQKSFKASQLNEIIMEVKEYTRYHFRREETIMKACDYPNLDNHLALHQQLVSQLSVLSDDWFENKNPETLQKLRKFLKAWLIGHIETVDTTIAHYAEGKERKIRQALKKIELTG